MGFNGNTIRKTWELLKGCKDESLTPSQIAEEIGSHHKAVKESLLFLEELGLVDIYATESNRMVIRLR